MFLQTSSPSEEPPLSTPPVSRATQPHIFYEQPSGSSPELASLDNCFFELWVALSLQPLLHAISATCRLRFAPLLKRFGAPPEQNLAAGPRRGGGAERAHQCPVMNNDDAPSNLKLRSEVMITAWMLRLLLTNCCRYWR